MAAVKAGSGSERKQTFGFARYESRRKKRKKRGRLK
jgi:hypothetical protein